MPVKGNPTATGLASVIGDTFIDWKNVSPQKQWERIVALLYEHGYIIVRRDA
jgi:hypothetical protein